MPQSEITESNHCGHCQELCQHLARIEKTLDKLAAAFDQYEPLIAAFGNGGMLAARTALKRTAKTRRIGL